MINFKQDKNLGYSIGHGTVLNPRIENENIISVLLDTYDFNKFDNRPIVILGRNEQNTGNSIPYYSIINVKIPLEQWIKWFTDYKL